LPEYDRVLETFVRSDSDAQQIAAARRMTEIELTYMPQLPAAFRLESNFVNPWVRGFSPMVFSSYWKYLDIDLDARRRSTGK
jgi:hypothetical protein